MGDLLKDIKDIVKWTEEGIKCNEFEFRERVNYESFAYRIIKNKIEKEKENDNG